MCDCFYLKHLVELNVNHQNKRMISPQAFSQHRWVTPTLSDVDLDKAFDTLELDSSSVSKAFPRSTFDHGSVPRLITKECPEKPTPLRDDPVIYFILPRNLQYLSLSGAITVDADYMEKIIILGARSLRHLDFSDNGMSQLLGPVLFDRAPDHKVTLNLSNNLCTFVNPLLAEYCGTFFENLILSYNRLGKQLKTDHTSSVFGHFVDLKYLDLSFNEIKILHSDVFINQSHLLSLNFSGNSLQFLNFKIMHMNNLTTLDLSRNLLLQISEDCRNHIQSLTSRPNLYIHVYLHGNPLVCDCDSLSFLRWLNEHQAYFMFINSTTCIHNETLESLSVLDSYILPELELQCHSMVLLIIVLSVLSLLIITLAVSVCAYRHRFEIRYLFC